MLKLHGILETLALLATTGTLVSGCDKSQAQTTEVPAAQECLHADGCCGGHTPGDASCGQEGAAKPPGWTNTWTVAPGDMAEINLELAAGDTMVAKFASDGGTLKWNVHSHEGDNAVMHAQGDDAEGAPGHTAAKAGMYSFMWTNAGKTPVTLTIELELGGSAKVHSTHPAR
jgi:hypothetical protein